MILRAIGTAALGLLIAATGASTPLPRAASWARSADRLAALTTQPAECLRPAADAEMARAVAVGRVAFRTPTLLGGAAARAGMSCAACHSNGRRNAHFYVEGLSDAPGTADVTSSITSSHRGDDIFNPLPIPDLAHPAKIGRDPADPALDRFVRSVITQEFDGPPPPPAAFAALLAYVRALTPCAPEHEVPIDLAAALDDVARAVAAAQQALASGDADTARLMLGGARAALEEISQRYPGPVFATERAGLVRASVELGEVQARLEPNPAEAARRLLRWRLAPPLVAALHQGADRSLYDRMALAAALAHE